MCEAGDWLVVVALISVVEDSIGRGATGVGLPSRPHNMAKPSSAHGSERAGVMIPLGPRPSSKTGNLPLPARPDMSVESCWWLFPLFLRTLGRKIHSGLYTPQVHSAHRCHKSPSPSLLNLTLLRCASHRCLSLDTAQSTFYFHFGVKRHRRAISASRLARHPNLR